jgi:hypothetical protein
LKVETFNFIYHPISSRSLSFSLPLAAFRLRRSPAVLSHCVIAFGFLVSGEHSFKILMLLSILSDDFLLSIDISVIVDHRSVTYYVLVHLIWLGAFIISDLMIFFHVLKFLY